MIHKIRGVRVEDYAYHVNKLRQNVSLETWLWRQIVTSQTAHTKHKWPPYATDRNPPWKFSAYAIDSVKYAFLRNKGALETRLKRHFSQLADEIKAL